MLQFNVGWSWSVGYSYFWLGLLTCKNRRPYNLYCVDGDVKPCTINQQSMVSWSVIWL